MSKTRTVKAWADRFWEKTDPQERRYASRCWDWLGFKTRAGYGKFWLFGYMQMAHRVAYELVRQVIVDPEMTIDHLCKNKGCVNPEHMQIVTREENSRRGNLNTGKSHCKNGHKFTEGNTYLFFRPKGLVQRQCKTCWLAIRKKQRVTYTLPSPRKNKKTI